MLRREQKEEREVSNNPSVIFLRKCHLPLHKGGFFICLQVRTYSPLIVVVRLFNYQ